MKTIALLTFLLLSFQGFSQQNLYSFNNGILYPEKEIRVFLGAMKKSMSAGYEIKPIVYHKVFKKDTVVNYISFLSSKKSSAESLSDIEFEYQQDSTFLLLDHLLPAFKLTDLDSANVSSSSLLGKPTLINFWATYCGPCIAEMPQLSRLKEKYKGQVNFISITENDANLDSLNAFLKNKDFNFQILDRGGSYKKELKIAAIPKNLFIDKKGVLRYVQGNYPMSPKGVPISLESKDNFFTKIIEELIKESL
jgi:thiol-disulfide isomerase/thioredoxin